jgi:hypothetical protein
MRSVCVLDGTGETLFTLNTADYPLRENDHIEANSVIYKVESVLLKVTVLPDAVTAGASGIPPATIPGKERSWSSGELFVTLSVVP